MSSALSHMFRLWAGLGVAVALLVPSFASVAYHCGESGEMLVAPCARDDRGAGEASARACCGGEEETPAPAAEGTTCCRTLGTEHSLLPASIGFEEPELAITLPTTRVPDRDSHRVAGRAAVAWRAERPPGDPPPYVLHCQFLI